MTQFNASAAATTDTVVRCYHEGGKDGERDTFCVVTTAVPLLSIRPFIRHDDDEEHASAKSTRILPFIQLKKNSRPYIYYCAFQKEQRKFVFLKSS